MQFKIVYYQGSSISSKTRFESGKAITTDNGLLIKGQSEIQIPHKSIQNVELFRLNGLGRMIKITALDNQTTYLTVVRLNLGGYFVIVNFFDTGKLYKYLNYKV